MLLGNILWDTDFPKIGCKDTTNFAHTQINGCFFAKSNKILCFVDGDMPHMLA